MGRLSSLSLPRTSSQVSLSEVSLYWLRPPTLPDLTHLYELLGSPSDTRSSQEITLNSPIPHYDSVSSIPSPRIIHPVNDEARPSIIHSASIPPLPPTPTPSQTATFHPSDWRKIPQKVYGYGKKQWDFRPSEPVLFHVNGRPGVNMGDAFRKKFTGLDGRDDLMLRLAGDAFSCRLWVRSSHRLPSYMRVDGLVGSSPGTRSTAHPR